MKYIVHMTIRYHGEIMKILEKKPTICIHLMNRKIDQFLHELHVLTDRQTDRPTMRHCYVCGLKYTILDIIGWNMLL